MKAIVNTKLVMEDGIIWNGALTYEGNTILQVGKADQVEIPPEAEIFDARGLYTAPGLIDIHNHGGGDWLFAQEPAYCAAHFLRHGVTTVLPTFYHSLSLTQMLEGAEKIRQVRKTGAGRAMEGLYMEGPFMNLSGSYQNQIQWSGAIKQEEVTALVDGLGDLARIWAVDPNRENLDCFLEYIRAKHPEAILANGHSRATSEAIRALRRHNLKVCTHITDSGQAKGRAQGTPGAGGDQYCLYEPDMYAELICDETGIHVPPDLVKLIVQTKGVRKVILISDSMGGGRTDYKNNEAEGIWYGPDLNYDDRGWLAGSRMTLENAVRNMMTHTGYGLCHAIRMATLNPAQLLGIDHKVGSLEPGKKANLILIDDMVHVKRVILEGDLSVVDGELTELA